MTPYHAKYWAWDLLKRGAPGSDRLSQSLLNSVLDLNPHQVEAALFALKNPLSQGVMLADETGLGKTIEGGLLLSQFWAEGKRKLLVICPAALRKQWSFELQDKFHLPSTIGEGKNALFPKDSIWILSINTAANLSNTLSTINWDLVIFDEAHKLRNCYQPSNVNSQKLLKALKGTRKVLLTATPLQNSLVELYGLFQFIDDLVFGDISTFRFKYLRDSSNIKDLRERIAPFIQRTLRRQAQEFIRFTKRIPITRTFTPTDNEHRLYEELNKFLQREESYSIPKRQKQLVLLIMRKLLASSPRAIAGTLVTVRKRLQSVLENSINSDWKEIIMTQEDLDDEEIEALLDEGENEENEANEQLINREALKEEISLLDKFIAWAEGISLDAKVKELLTALTLGFQEMEKLGGARKALIFTESRRSQEYIKTFLEANGYRGKIALFNGSNSDDDSLRIYEQWKSTQEPSRLTGRKSIDIRAAIIDYFREAAEIMIATEAGAEGLNLQFCSLVINYDLPWNPQRIEQRIGRCHRYGQQSDVAVINFLNTRNEADNRVFELLDDKFHLFQGLFGASDEVLGALANEIDFEKRVLQIYQTCRTSEEIKKAFDDLERELEETLKLKMKETRQKLMDNFDEDVVQLLRNRFEETTRVIDLATQIFWNLTQWGLEGRANFTKEAMCFELFDSPLQDVPPGTFHLLRTGNYDIGKTWPYHLSHPLASWILEQAKKSATPQVRMRFNPEEHLGKISLVEFLKGKSGWLTLNHLTIDSATTRDFLLFSGIKDDGSSLTQEEAEKLFRIEAEIVSSLDEKEPDRLGQECIAHRDATIHKIAEEDNTHFLNEQERLSRWADDQIEGLEKQIKDIKRRIKEKDRDLLKAPTVQEQISIQEELQHLNATKQKLRREQDEREDEIRKERDGLIAVLRKRVEQKTTFEKLYTIQWEVI